MQPQIRSENRLLSSLRDLRLNKNIVVEKPLQRKRQNKRLCPIKTRSQDSMIYEKFKVIQKRKSQLDLNFISQSLSQHFTFSSLMEVKNMQDQVIDKFKMCKIDEKQYLMKQNDKASSFFILKQGELIVQVNGQQKGIISPGEGFGELALLYSIPRSASILAKKSSVLWFIDRATFRSVVSSLIQKTYNENKKFIQNNKFFSYLNEKQKQKITSIALTQRFQKGGTICQQGQKALSMYIIKSGRVKRYINGLLIGEYQYGDSFQQYAALTKNCLRKQTIIADQTTQLMAFGTQDIQKVLRSSLPIIIIRNNAKKVLLQDKNFRLLSNQLLERVIDCFEIKNVIEGEQIFAAGDFCKNKIIFVIEGQYILVKSQHYNSLYGSQCVIPQKRMTTYNCKCVFKTQGKIAITTIQKIQQAIGCTISQAISKSNSAKRQIQTRRSKLLDLKTLAKTFNIKDFLVLKKLGEGQFGQVFLVTYGKSNKVYALKCISKAETLKYKIEKHLINQKKVLEILNSPFTVDFIRSFNDDNYVYFLTEFIDGLELFDALRIIGIVSVNLAAFYTAILIHTLESLHTNSIIYRDLKPQNIMVQGEGYLKLIDMGTCKNLKTSISNKTFTIIGTPNYMAPQILSGKGYSYSADLWSLGIMLFQFLSGYLPFGEHCEDPYQIYEEILTTQLKFPKYMNNNAANSLINRLLNRNPQFRIGQSYSELKNHQFLKQIDWTQLIEKKIIPSFKPPSDCLLKLQTLQKNPKTIDHYLKHLPQSGPKRTDINLNWDACF